MKKILSALVILLVVSCAPAFAGCAINEKEIITGSACSINELNNNNLEKSKLNPPKVLIREPKKERNLRPIRYQSKISNVEGCPTVICLNRILLGTPLEGLRK